VLASADGAAGRPWQGASWRAAVLFPRCIPWRYSDPVVEWRTGRRGFIPQWPKFGSGDAALIPRSGPCGLLWLDHAEQSRATALGLVAQRSRRRASTLQYEMSIGYVLHLCHNHTAEVAPSNNRRPP